MVGEFRNHSETESKHLLSSFSFCLLIMVIFEPRNWMAITISICNIFAFDGSLCFFFFFWHTFSLVECSCKHIVSIEFIGIYEFQSVSFI